MRASGNYQYDRFYRELMYDDLQFRGGRAPGDVLPDVDLLTTDGAHTRTSELRGRPLLLTMGSITCPMTQDAALALRRLHEQFKDRVTFLTLYVREAHPGERYPQPHSFERKIAHARAYQERDAIPWPVAVDTVDGLLHQTLEPKPNALYVVGADGRVAFRALWSNDYATVRRAIQQVIDRPAAIVGEAVFQPLALLRGVGVMRDVLVQAGPQAERDMLRAVPPLFALVWVAGLFRPLPPLGRSITAVALAIGAAAALGVAAQRMARLSRE